MKSLLDSVDVSTRGKRRRATALVISLLEKIRYAEEKYLERIPCNLQSSEAYFEADYSVDVIIETIICLLRAY